MGLSQEERIEQATLAIVLTLHKYQVAFKAPEHMDDPIFLIPAELVEQGTESRAVH